MKEQEDLNQHSEKVRKILGDIPPALIRLSVVILSIITIGLIIVFFFGENPYLKGESILHRILGV